MTQLRLGHATLIAIAVSILGCAPATPQQQLTGKWKATPPVNEAVNEAVDTAAQGQKVNPLARGAANFMGNLLASATMYVEVDLRESGTAFYRGNTQVIGFPPDSDGKWEVVSANGDLIQVRLSTGEKKLEGNVLFRDKDEFSLKFEATVKDEKSGEEKTVPTTLVFARFNE